MSINSLYQKLQVIGQFILRLDTQAKTDAAADGEVQLWYDATAGAVKLRVYSLSQSGWSEFHPTSLTAPVGADYLVGTASSGLSNEIVVGSTPGGELGGSWAAPTVDTSHAEGSHSSMIGTHTGDGDAHHGESHVVGSSGPHAETGLTAGHVLRASGASAFGFATLQASDLPDHAARHERGGADEVDGDQLDIDWNPSNYTPATTPSEVTSVDHLTAHLYGVDHALASKAGTSHGSSHIDGGSDAIDGDKLEITWSPSNYTPSASPVEVDSVDDLTAHLYGIDQALDDSGWEVIAQGSLPSSGTTWIDVSDIDSGFHLFRILVICNCGSAAQPILRFNDSSSGYLWNTMYLAAQNATTWSNANGGATPNDVRLTRSTNADDRTLLEITMGQYDAAKASGVCHWTNGSEWDAGTTWFSWSAGAKISRVTITGPTTDGGTYRLLGYGPNGS